MKKIMIFVSVLVLGLSLARAGWAEEAGSQEPSPVSEEKTASPAAAPEAPAAEQAPAASPVSPAPASTENLEFVSGEVSAVDEAAKSITVKLYGETENEASNKALTVKVDETTDITDGEKDRDLKSLTSGTEVDVEYDPASNKATYIFVY
jgi:hypothetical protein